MTTAWASSSTICRIASVISPRTGPTSKTSRSSASTTTPNLACCRSASPPACTTPRISMRQRNGPLHPHLAEEYKKWSGGRDWKKDFPEWEPEHRILFKNGILGIENVGGDIDKVTGRRCTFALFPWNWERGDGCIIRLVAIIDRKGSYRIEKGEKF